MMSNDQVYRVHTQLDDYWVLSKSAGVSIHAESDELGLFEQLHLDFPKQTFYPVHRLDKLTSGLLIVALNKRSAATFGRLFEGHEIDKYYIAISDRKPKKKQGSIKGGMQPSRRGQWKLTYGKENLAITSFFSESIGDGKRVYYVRPKTGKTHQIRVALKSLGAPILGDERYSGTSSDRCYLHAYKISFLWQGALVEYVDVPIQGLHFNDLVKTKVVSFFNQIDLIRWPD